MIKKKEYFSHGKASNSMSMIIPKDIDVFPFNTQAGGSYNLAPARVLGLSYAQYLIFLRTMFPEVVEVRGKNSIYPVAYWKKGKEMYTFIELLNSKLSMGIGEAIKQLEEEEKELIAEINRLDLILKADIDDASVSLTNISELKDSAERKLENLKEELMKFEQLIAD